MRARLFVLSAVFCLCLCGCSSEIQIVGLGLATAGRSLLKREFP